MEPSFKLEPLGSPYPGAEVQIPLPDERESLLNLIEMMRERVKVEDGVADNDPRGYLFALMRTRSDYGVKMVRLNEFKRFMSEASIQHLDRMIVVHSETYSYDRLLDGVELNLGLLHYPAVEFRGLKHDLGALPEHWRTAYEDVLHLETGDRTEE